MKIALYLKHTVSENTIKCKVRFCYAIYLVMLILESIEFSVMFNKLLVRLIAIDGE
jgi:hypothetical protein